QVAVFNLRAAEADAQQRFAQRQFGKYLETVRGNRTIIQNQSIQLIECTKLFEAFVGNRHPLHRQIDNLRALDDQVNLLVPKEWFTTNVNAETVGLGIDLSARGLYRLAQRRLD